jgi:hypothetical protein
MTDPERAKNVVGQGIAKPNEQTNDKDIIGSVSCVKERIKKWNNVDIMIPVRTGIREINRMRKIKEKQE